MGVMTPTYRILRKATVFDIVTQKMLRKWYPGALLLGMGQGAADRGTDRRLRARGLSSIGAHH